MICALAVSTLAFGCRKILTIACAVHRGRFDVLDVIDQRGEDALVDGGDAAFHLFGVQAGILPGQPR